ncbi:hypothetical protein LSH36_202g06003 [Paralvinella palmiformis]|uniref:Macro domain-containing protein n=1 Tax=Paralvinella palmiformis TaxID=53620 RepID=A0AAD9JPQ5_9ANNE|nr:hypothetical protein LSH36_202g06003 [Paralvinella palmiformis]
MAFPNYKQDHYGSSILVTPHIYSHVNSVLKPELVNFLDEYTDNIRTTIEECTGAKFDQEINGITGTWNEVAEAHKQLTELFASKTAPKYQYECDQNDGRGVSRRDNAELHRKQSDDDTKNRSKTPDADLSSVISNSECCKSGMEDDDRGDSRVSVPATGIHSAEKLASAEGTYGRHEHRSDKIPVSLKNNHDGPTLQHPTGAYDEMRKIGWDGTTSQRRGSANGMRNGSQDDDTLRTLSDPTNEMRKSSRDDIALQRLSNADEMRKDSQAGPTLQQSSDANEMRKGSQNENNLQKPTDVAQVRKGNQNDSTFKKTVDGNEMRKDSQNDTTLQKPTGLSEMRRSSQDRSTLQKQSDAKGMKRDSQYVPTLQQPSGANEIRKGSQDGTTLQRQADANEMSNGNQGDTTFQKPSDPNQMGRSSQDGITSQKPTDAARMTTANWDDATLHRTRQTKTNCKRLRMNEPENHHCKRMRNSQINTTLFESNDQTDPKHDSQGQKDSTVKIGTCQHHSCTFRSKPSKFRLEIIQFITKYCEKRLAEEMQDHALYICSQLNKKLALVYCCGDDGEDAEHFIQIFEDYYSEIEETLCSLELSYCSEGGNCLLLRGIKCVIYNKAEDRRAVLCEKDLKHKVSRILEGIHSRNMYECGCRSASNIKENVELKNILPAARKSSKSRESCADSISHSIKIDLDSRPYWNHITQFNGSFIDEFDKLVQEYNVKLDEDGNRLELKGRSIKDLKHLQRFICEEYTVSVSKLKMLCLKDGSVNTETLKNQYPQISVAKKNRDKLVLVGDCDVIDKFLKEFDIRVEDVLDIKTGEQRKEEVAEHGLSPEQLRHHPSSETAATAKEEHHSSLPEEATSAVMYVVPCGFLTLNSIQIYIHKCDITKLQVDAIVNAANEFLKHGAGVAKAIAEAAGPQLESEGREIINNLGPVPISNNVITSAGRLPCRKVIHAVGPRWPSEHDEKEKKHCLKLLHDTFTNIILTADKERFESLAMPPVSSGIFRVPKDEVARIICEVLTTADTKYLKQVHIVDITDQVLPLIAGAFLKKNKQDSVIDLPLVIILNQEECQKGTLLIHNRVKVYISCNDITKVKADAIVCSNDVNLSSSSGLAKKIADLCGKDYRKQLEQAAKNNNLRPADVFCLRSDKLGLVINAVVPRLKSLLIKRNYEDGAFKELLSATFHNAIDNANKHEVSCLAISPLGSDQQAVPNSWVPEILSQALIDTLRSDKQIQEVHIVDIDNTILKPIRKELEKHSKYVHYSSGVEGNPQSSASLRREQATGSVTGQSRINRSVADNDGSDVDLVAGPSKAANDEDEKPVVFSSSYRRNGKIRGKENSHETASTSSSSFFFASING